MSDIQSKPNDWLVATVSNPDLGLANFAEAGLSAENTQLKDRDFYKNNSFIQDAFKTQDGKFDQNAFNKKYDEALKTYETFAADNYDKTYLDQLSSSFTNSFRSPDSKIRDENLVISKVKNPFKQFRGLQGFGSIEDNPLSLSEIAQQNKVFDFDSGKFLDWSPNDKTGISSFFRDPLVLAQWDDDGMHIDDSGKQVMHKKGDLRFNEDGDVYYETLGKRDASKKQFLSSWDTLTTDGSLANSFDIFDADDKEQSIGKAVARMALKWAPLAIAGLASGGTSTLATAAINFNKVYLGTTALLTLADAVPMMYKAAEGIVTNNEDPNQRSGLWNVMNSWQSRSQSYKMGTSEYSKNKTFTWENVINMTSDVMLQLGQQRFIAEIPGYLGLQKKFVDSAIKAGEMPFVGQQKFNDFSKMLATYYMTATSGADAYNTAIQSGMEERTAGLVTLGTLVGLHQIMKSDIGQWPLKQIGLDDVRLAIKPVIKEESEKAAQVYGKEAVDAAVKSGDKNGALKFVKSIGDAVANRIKGFVEDPTTLMGAAIKESIEEVSEEMTQDTVFALAKAGEALGITRKSDYTWAGSDPFGRYAMSAVGGAIGGSMHHINWRGVNSSIDHETKRDIIYAVYKYGAEEVNKQIEQLYTNNKLAGSKTLGTKAVKDADGKIHFVDADDETDTQAFAIKEQLKNTVTTYEQLLERTGSNGLDLDTRRALFLDGDEGLQKLAGFGITDIVKNDLMELNQEIVDLSAKVEDLQGPEGKGDPGDYGKRLNELILEKKMILTGERFDDYFQQGLLHLNKDLASLFTMSSVQDMSFKLKGKPYESLSKVEKEALDKQYINYKEKQANDLKYAVKILNDVNHRIEPKLINYNDDYVKVRQQTLIGLSDNFDQQVKALQIANESGEIDPEKLNELVAQIRQGMDMTGTPVSQNASIAGLNSSRPNLENVTDDDIKEQLIYDHELQKRQARIDSYNIILQNINAFKSSGLPLDEEVAKKFRETIKQVNTMRTGNFKTDIQNKIESQFENESERIGFSFDKIPVIKDLLSNSFDIRKFDAKEFNKKIDDLTTEDLFSQISKDGLKSTVYYNEDEDGEIIEVPRYDESLTDDELAKEFKKDLKNYVKLAKNVIDSEYHDDLEFMNSVENELKSTIKNPIYNYINEVSKLTGSGTQGLFDVLSDEENRLNEKNFDDFTNYVVANGDNLQVLKNALKDIAIAKKLIEHRTADESMQSYGYVLNAYRQKYSPKLEQLTLLSRNTVGIMLTDLAHLENQINFFIQLSMYNAADKLREHKKIGAKFMMNFAKLFADDGEFNLIRNNLGFDLLDGVENILTSDMDARNILINVFPKSISSGANIDDESLGKAEVLLNKVEDKIFENFKKYREANPNADFEETFKKLIGVDIFGNRTKNDPNSVVEGITSSLSSDSEEGLTDYDKLQYLATLLSSKSSDFKTLLKQHIENMPEDSRIAPIFGQEYPARIAYGLILNPEIFNGANSFIKDEKGDSFYALAQNLLFINGNPGTGKTSATAQLIHSLVKAHYGDNFTVSSILDRQVNALNESLSEIKEGKNKTTLISAILKGGKVEEFFKEGYTADDFKAKDFVNDEKLKALGNNLEIGKVIYIDEVTHYTADELLVLSRWANLTNRVLITFGDVLQNGKKRDIQFLNSVKSPSLEYSMRSGSVIGRDNNNVFRVICKKLNDYEIFKVDNDGSKLSDDQIVNKQREDLNDLSDNLTLKYYESPAGVITGAKILPDAQFDKDAMSTFINASIKDGSDPKNIAIIYKSVTQADFKDLQDVASQYNVQLLKEDEMQGSEFDYVILSTNLNPLSTDYADSPLDYAKSLNTLFSRSKLGVLARQSGLSIKNERSNFNDRHEIPKEVLDKFKESRLVPLRTIAGENTEFEIKVPTIEEEMEKRSAHTEPPQQGTSTDSTKAHDEVKKEILKIKDSNNSYDNDDEIGPNGEIINPNKRADGISAGYLNYRTFGGYFKDGKYKLPVSREKGVKNLYFDLQRFATTTSNGFVTEISNQDDDIDNKMFQRYDRFVNQLYDGMTSGKTALEVIEELKKNRDNYFVQQEMLDSLDWANAKFKLLYTKPDKQFDKNIEVGGGQDESYLNKDMIKRLVIFVDSTESDGDPLAITVGSVGFKSLNKGESDESTKLDDAVRAELKTSKNGYVTRVIDPSAFEKTGSYTRLEHLGAIDFSMQDYIENDPKWKKLTAPMIFTGKLPLNLDSDLLDDTAKNYKEKVERYLYEQSMNGRAFTFITYSPELENYSDKEMVTYFFNQRIERLQNLERRKRGEALAERKYPGKITMLMLDPKSRTLNEFLTDFRKGVEEIKSGNKSALNSISNRYLGVNMLKSVYELNQYLHKIPKDKRSSKENQWHNNTWQILSIIQREFKLKPITVKDSNGNDKTELVLVDDKAVQKPIELSETMLKDALSLKSNNDSEYRKNLYQNYYAQLPGIASKEDKSFNDLLLFFADLTNPVIKDDAKATQRVIENSVKAPWFEETLEVAISNTNKGNEVFKDRDGQFKTRFPNGINIHPIYLGTKSSETVTDWMEPAANNYSDFVVTGARVEGRRIKIRHGNSYIFTEDSYNDKLKKELEGLNKTKQILSDNYKNTNISLKLHSELENIIKSESNFNSRENLERISKRLNDAINGYNLITMNPADSTNPIVKLEMEVDLNLVATRLTSYSDVKKLDIDSIKIKTDSIDILTKDGKNYTFKDGKVESADNVITVHSHEEQVKLTEKINKFIDGLTDDNDKIFITNFFTNNTSFDEVKKFAQKFKEDKKFRELLEEKLEQECS